ncbi:MAG: hypothetical protein LBF49_00470 [Puniceicoccales bacterium]|jgi:hypothetical protein|nr:hypothetical protein [Puniceicoccales bacterium]
MESNIVDNIDVNRAEYFYKHGRAKVRDPALKMNLTIHKENEDVEVNAYVVGEEIQPGLLRRGMVYIHSMTERDAKAIGEHLPPKTVPGYDNPLHFITNSPKVVDVIKRFIDITNHSTDERFKEGKEMKL